MSALSLFDPDKPVIVAVSGGPDSMALADKLYQAGYDLILAHVNYHKRDSADRDQKIVEEFARKRKLPVVIKDYFDNGKKGNFQARARAFRYDFFFDLAKTHQSDQIAVGHHLDDVLETYLMQKRRKAIPEVYGLKEIREEKGLKIIRPLLDCTKQDLIDYCYNNSIIYGTDESNLTDHYERNRIRHHLLDPLSPKEKRLLLEQMKKENASLAKRRKQAQKLLCGPVSEWINSQDAWFVLTVLWIELMGKALSKKEAIEQLKKLKQGWLKLADGWLIVYHAHLYFFPEQKAGKKRIENSGELKAFKADSWNITSSNTGEKIENLRVLDKEYPLTIRNAREGDEIEMRYGSKKLSRFFIDKKIPKPLRNHWPVIENRQGKIIYVFGLGAERGHFDLEQGIYLHSPYKSVKEILAEYAIII